MGGGPGLSSAAGLEVRPVLVWTSAAPALRWLVCPSSQFPWILE